MPIFWLTKKLVFPSPHLAEPDGVLALGGDLSPKRLLLAYQHGIFPWYNEDEPIMWWSPNPRFVLFPENLKVSKSMRQVLRRQIFEVTFDKDFRGVITGCQRTKRSGQFGTWITEAMLEAYCNLHDLGYAHSVEVWQDNQLVGGLYGISLGKCFFGESMFTTVSNASKTGFITLVRKLQARDFKLIDCQTHSNHLESLGAQFITREQFLKFLATNRREKTLRGNWGSL